MGKGGLRWLAGDACVEAQQAGQGKAHDSTRASALWRCRPAIPTYLGLAAATAWRRGAAARAGAGRDRHVDDVVLLLALQQAGGQRVCVVGGVVVVVGSG